MDIKSLKEKWKKVKECFAGTTAVLAPYPTTGIVLIKNDKKKLQKRNS